MTVLSPAEKKIMEKFLIELIADCAMPLSIVERGSFKRFVNSMRLVGSENLPGRTKVREKLLPVAAASVKEEMDANVAIALENGHRAGMIVDTWSNRMIQVSAHGPGAFFLFAIRVLFGRAAGPTKSILW